MKTLGLSFFALMVAASAATSSAQSLQSAGDVILNLQSVDLNSTSVWTNRTINPNAVGDMHTVNGSPLNVASLSYGAGAINALNINQTGGNSLQSALDVPAEIIGNGPVSVETWIFANDVDPTSAMLCYGNTSGNEFRDFNYDTSGHGIASFYGPDQGWPATDQPTAGVWHYIAYTYDGVQTLTAYQDGVPISTNTLSTLLTPQTLLDVGADSPAGGGDPFHGYIAAARLESGVLNASQIANNFNAGLLGTFSVLANTPIVSPSTNAFLGDTVTFTEVAQSSQPLTYQWYGDNGTGGVTFSPVNGQTATNFVLNTSTLAGVGTYEYEVVVTGGSDSVTSAPVVLKVNPASLPILSQDTTPSAPNNIYVGASLTFSASFIGSQTITYQWQISTDGGASFQNLTGDANSTLLLTNLQAASSGEYRLKASNSLGSTDSTPATLTVLSERPQLQVAGQMLVNLQAADLNSEVNVWTNEINGVGDFSTIGGTNLHVANLTYQSQAVKGLSVGLSTNNAVVSALQAPVGITANGPVSIEAWVYPTNDVNANNSGNNTAVSYGVQGGSGAPMEQREFNYNTGGNGALSGDFGDLDTGWSGTLTLNTWHYLVYTYDGTTFRLYMDGVQNNTVTPGSLNTVQTALLVGAGIAGTDPTGADGFGDPFGGYIAAVRVETGTLSSNEVANNYLAGPLQTISIVISPATISPTNIVFRGDTVTLSVANVQSLQALTYQWQTDNGSGGATWSDISGATGTNYTFTTTVTETNEYQLLATGTSTTAASVPVTLKVLPPAAPSVLQNTTPGSVSLFAGQQITFTASFNGNEPITNQWQVSTDDGATFNNIPGADTMSLVLTGLQVTNSGEYRLEASNAFGTNTSTPATLIVQPVSAEPQPQIAGDVIVDLQSQDLSAGSGSWPNRSVSPNSVGDFIGLSTTSSTLNVTNVIYDFQPIEVLAVDGVSGNAVQSTDDTPPEILGNSPFSAEAWIFATTAGTGSSFVLAYGLEGGAAAPAENREMGYFNQGYGAFTGNFGNSDTGWSTTPTTGAWHYLAWTYNGTNVNVYQDGQPNGTGGGPLNTPQTFMEVGSDIGNGLSGVNGGNNPFEGYIASVRVESGVLSASQIAHNYLTGPAGTIPTGSLVPLTFTSTNGVLTLNWTPANAAILLETTNLSGPWTTNNSATPPYTVVPSAGVPREFYRLQYP